MVTSSFWVLNDLVMIACETGVHFGFVVIDINVLNKTNQSTFFVSYFFVSYCLQMPGFFKIFGVIFSVQAVNGWFQTVLYKPIL